MKNWNEGGRQNHKRGENNLMSSKLHILHKTTTTRKKKIYKFDVSHEWHIACSLFILLGFHVLDDTTSRFRKYVLHGSCVAFIISTKNNIKFVNHQVTWNQIFLTLFPISIKDFLVFHGISCVFTHFYLFLQALLLTTIYSQSNL